ncbi:hypothetical protein LWI29_001834, partial [Acer saccharum]
MVMLIVNYDGVWEDVDFNPKTIFLLAVTPKDTLKTLSDKICDRFGLNCDAVDMKFSTLLSGTVVQMSFDADFQIFIAHNKKNPKCYVSVFHNPVPGLSVLSDPSFHRCNPLDGICQRGAAYSLGQRRRLKNIPIGIGFAASECKGSWTWFLSELKKGIGSPQDLVIVSDRHRGIISAMNEVFPYAQHAFCVFHIAQKFRRSSKNQSLAREFFYNACYQHRRDDCDIDLQQMAACNQ